MFLRLINYNKNKILQSHHHFVRLRNKITMYGLILQFDRETYTTPFNNLSSWNIEQLSTQYALIKFTSQSQE